VPEVASKARKASTQASLYRFTTTDRMPVAASVNIIWNRKLQASSARKKNLPVSVNKYIPAVRRPKTKMNFEKIDLEKEIIPDRFSLATGSFMETIH